MLFHFLTFNIFRKFGSSNFGHRFSAILIFRDQKSILFDTEKLAFIFSNNFKTLEKFQFLLFFIIFGFFWRTSRSKSKLTHLFVPGKKHTYRKRIMKHISKLHFSTEKCERLCLFENLQLRAASEL